VAAVARFRGSCDAFVSLASMRVRVGVILFVLAALAFVTSCSSDKSGSPTDTTVDPASYIDRTTERSITIEARDDLFTPQYTKIRAGTTVIFKNAGRNQHNVISTDQAFHDIGTDAFAPGVKVRVVFDKLGTHDYYCSLHGSATAGMRGSLLVVP
jgi:plastocyanin